MGCDMVAALAGATVNGRAIFGHNAGRPEQERQRLLRAVGRSYALGEKVSTGTIELPQARTTFTVLGSQAEGMWGYHHGVNEMGVAIGCTHLRTRLGEATAGLAATDLVRLALERSAGARQAVDMLTDLLARHGQVAANPTQRTDGAFLITDGREAFVLETTSKYWVLQEIREVRALSDDCTIRQDWNRIAPGLAAEAIERKLWPEDGTKIDFAGVVAAPTPNGGSAAKRWARATYLLQEQNGRIDLAFVRRILADHYETDDEEESPANRTTHPLPICQHQGTAGGTKTAISLVAELDSAADGLPVAWCAFGPPCRTVYFPIFLAGILPEPFSSGELERTTTLLAGLRRPAFGASTEAPSAREHFSRFQELLDQQASDFLNDAREWKRQGDLAELQRQASLFHQHTLESFERLAEESLPVGHVKAASSEGLQPAGGMAPAPWA
jgi:secernin